MASSTVHPLASLEYKLDFDTPKLSAHIATLTSGGSVSRPMWKSGRRLRVKT